MNPHKHSEVIHAFADGAQIQVRAHDDQEWTDVSYPDFDPDFQYRVKPEPKAPTYVWFNVFRDPYVYWAHAYGSKEAADCNASKFRVGRIKVELSERFDE